MRKWNSLIWVILVISCSLTAQDDRAALERKRNVLLQQIKETNQLISAARKRQENTVNNLVAMRKEIGLREAVLGNLSAEVELANRQIGRQEKRLDNLRKSMTTLREEQARQLRTAYIRERLEHRTAYLLSAKSLNDAYTRWRYLSAMTAAREKLYNRIAAAADSVNIELATLRNLQAEKQVLLEDVQEQSASLKNSVAESEKTLGELKKNEQQLKAQLTRQEKERADLTREIEAIIKAELASREAAGDLPDAPAVAALSAEFAQNRGKLPWPVEKGLITGHFGTQPHPVISSIKIVNNGIDITVGEKSPVSAIFGGKVVGIKEIPGFNLMVIIQHGQYYTVYSRLAKVSVRLGDTVERGQYLGPAAQAEDGSTRLHLEIWQGKKQLDPERWITR